MRDLHFGYERDMQDGLVTLLGRDHWGRELSVTTGIPYSEMPGDHGQVVTTPVERRAVIIEGDMDLVRELLGDDFNARMETIGKRLSKKKRA